MKARTLISRPLAVMTLAVLLIPAVFFGAAPSAPGTAYAQGQVKGDIVIFHAGSLSLPLQAAAREFEAGHPGVRVIMESSGSRDAARKVTDLGRRADIIASADYTVIKTLMMPEYADWYISFAGNEMVIMYTHQSRYAKEISGANWYDVLLRPGVEFGHSDPNADPCGYRALLTWKLAEKFYGKPGLYDRLSAARPLKNIRPKETDLIALLEAGELDYVFIYRSVAEQHGFPFVKLPDQINFKSAKYEDFYATVSVALNGKKPGEVITQIGQPMVYAVTIPSNAPNRTGAVEFLKFLLGPQGQKIMRDNGQPPIVPPKASDVTKIPAELRPLVEGE